MPSSPVPSLGAETEDPPLDSGRTSKTILRGRSSPARSAYGRAGFLVSPSDKSLALINKTQPGKPRLRHHCGRARKPRRGVASS
jgi:hypothetical protein